MDARIDINYSADELQEIVYTLVRIGVITSAEAIAPRELQTLQIDFFDINELIRLAFDRLVSYSNDSRKGWFDQSETDFFYEWFALQLLRKCPLNQYEPTCQDKSISLSRQERLVLQVGNYCASVDYQQLNHPELIAQLVSTVNLLLKQHKFELAYYELRGYDEISLFLLLTPK